MEGNNIYGYDFINTNLLTKDWDCQMQADQRWLPEGGENEIARNSGLELSKNKGVRPFSSPLAHA
jgi:hypothetical protein